MISYHGTRPVQAVMKAQGLRGGGERRGRRGESIVDRRLPLRADVPSMLTITSFEIHTHTKSGRVEFGGSTRLSRAVHFEWSDILQIHRTDEVLETLKNIGVGGVLGGVSYIKTMA